MEEPVSRPYSMSLRQRQIRKSFRAVDGADGTRTAGLEGAALATVAVGLKPGAMGKLERQLFGSRMKEYMKARDKILVKWFEDCTHPVDLLQLLGDEPDSSMQTLRDAYYFLQENGYINFGVLKERPAAVEEEEAEEDPSAEAVEDDKTIAFKLYELLRQADMETTSEKALRKQLQQHFKSDMNEKKAFIKEHVNYFIQNLERKETLEPLGFEGQQSEAQLRQKKKAAAAARKALAEPPAKASGRVIIVGAGPAGLAAATQLQRNNVDVLVLEARERVGGRVHSYQGSGFSAPVDLGASLITGTAPDAEAGLAPDPVSFVCKQLGIQLHMLGGKLPLFDAEGQQVAAEVDAAVDELRDGLLDAAQQAGEAGPTDEVLQQSLGQVLDQALQQRIKAAADQQQTKAGDAAAAAADANGTAPDGDAAAADGAGEKGKQAEQLGSKEDGGSSAPAVTPEMLRLLDWHWANLEYGCSAALSDVSLPHWNQDEEWGGFGGPHAMVVGGFDAALKGLAAQLGDKLRLSCPVSSIDYSAAQQADEGGDEAAEQQQQQVKVQLVSGEVLEAALVLVTVPLGVLQQSGVEFSPALPDWKAAAANKLGFGNLNKVVMQFPEVFWDSSVDYFGITQPPGEDTRGRCFMFWNLARFNDGAPLLAALVSGRSAAAAEAPDTQELQEHMLQTLRRVYGEKVSEPVAVKVTQWASDEFSRGSYSYVAVGCTGQEYDTLALPVSRCVLFAGEHTCKEHPDSVGGAMLSGLREAARAVQLLRGPAAADAAALVSSRTETLSKTDKRKRLEEADADRSKKQKRDKKRDKDQGKAGAKGKKGKGGKAKQEAGSSEEEEEEEEQLEEEQRGGRRRGAGAGESRKRRAAAEETPQRAVDRAALLDELARLWTGLLDAQQGECLTVLDVMRNCDSLDSRQQVMNAVMKASTEAVSHLSADSVFLSTLNTWLADLVVERSDANLHVLLRLLEMLASLKAAAWAGLTAAGLCVTVKKAAGHRNRDVASKSAALLKDWEARDPSKQKAPATKKPRLSGPSVLNLFNDKIGPQHQSTTWQPQPPVQQQHRQPPQQQKQQQQQPSKPQQQPKQSAVASTASTATAAAAAAGSAGALHEYMSEAEKEALAARQAALEEAEKQAAAAAAELAALEAAPAPRSSSRMQIDSFEKFERSSKRQRDSGGAEHGEGDGQHKHKHHRQHHRDSHHHEGKQSKHEGGGHQEAAADAAPDGKLRATKQLSDFVKASLKPRFQAKEVDNEDCKWLLGKVVAKVMDATTGADTEAAEFMTAKRITKVNALINGYLTKRKADKKAGLAGDADKRQTGKVSATAKTP